MTDCKDKCEEIKLDSLPNIVINITYNDMRIEKDCSTMVDNVDMRENDTNEDL